MKGSKLLQMFGTSAAVGGGGGGGGGGSSSGIVLTDDYVGGPVVAEWTLGYDGFVYHRNSRGAAFKTDPWVNPQVGMNLYEVEATVLSGDGPDGDIGIWETLGSVSRTWGFQTEYDGFEGQLQIQIRRASDHVILKTVTVSLTVSGLA